MTFSAIVILVGLRIAIGWQFFDEGLWKYLRVGTSSEWSAAGYLKNSRGPLRDRFRALLDDPDDLNWLDEKWVGQRWDDWKEAFLSHYELTSDQKQRLKELLEGPDVFAAHERFRLPARPDDRILQRKLDGKSSLARFLEVNKHIRLEEAPNSKDANAGAPGWRLVVDGKEHLLANERKELADKVELAERFVRQQAAAANDPKIKAYWLQQADLFQRLGQAVGDVFNRSKRLAFKERLRVHLHGDPENAARILRDRKGTVLARRIGKIDEYKRRLKRRDEMLSGAQTGFQWEQLQDEEDRLRKLHAELIGPVKKLESDLNRQARALLDDKQLAQAPLPMAPPGQIDRVNTAIMWALMILGVLLMAGLFSRTAAFFGGLLVLSFYLALPPWPGIGQPPGPEHSLIVNKNLLEVLALFALAVIPTGKLFGVDAMFIGCCRRKTDRPQKKTPPLSEPKRQKQSPPPIASRQTPAVESKTKSPGEQPVPASGGSGSAGTPPGDVYPIRRPPQK